MHFKIFFLILIGFCNPTYSQEIQIGDGKKTVLINVGGGSNSSSQEARIQMLERAVRDLQNQVFQLSMKQHSTPANLYVCEIQIFGKKYKSEKQALEYDAREQAKDRCSADNNEIHCNNPTCRKVN